jgi:hypothetical protein
MVDTQANNPAIDEPNDFEKLKIQNDEFEKELLRARQMRAEKQKIEAELMLSSTAGKQIIPEPAKVETSKEYAAKVMKGEIKAS